MTSFTDTILEPALWFLADWSLRWAAVIGLLLAWMVLRRPRRAATRHLVCCTVLVAGLALPVVPRWGGGVAVLRESTQTFADHEPRAATGEVAAPHPRDGTERLPIPRSEPTPFFVAEEAPAVLDPHPADEPLGTRRVCVLVLAGLWAAVVMLLLARGLVGWLLLKRIQQAAVPVEGAPAQLFEACCGELRVRRRVTFAMHPAVRSPITAGLLQPAILVPVTWPALPEGVQRGGILHELGHVARYDAWSALAMELVRAVFFFHPLVHWLLATIECERELLCDEIPLTKGMDPRDYARVLLLFSQEAGRLFPAAFASPAYPVPFGNRRTLKIRLDRLLEENMYPWMSPLPARRALALAAVVLGMALGLASFRLRATEADDLPPNPGNAVASVDDADGRAPEEDPPKGQDEKPKPVKKEMLRYGGKSFEDWRKELVTELKPELRAEGIKALSTFGAHGYAKEAVAIILEEARSYNSLGVDQGDQLVLEAARSGLTKIGPEAVGPLIEELTNGTRNGRLFALSALARLGGNAKPAGPAVARAITDKDFHVRTGAISALPSIDGNEPGAVPALVKALKDEYRPNRGEAVAALTRIGPQNKQVIPALLEALKNEDAHTRYQAVVQLTNMDIKSRAFDSSFIEALKDMDHRIRDQAWFGLQRRHPDAKTIAPLLLEALKGGDVNLRYNLINYLTQLGPDAKDAVPALIKALQVGKDNERLQAVVALSNVGPGAREAVPSLTALIQDENSNISNNALSALKRINKTEPVTRPEKDAR
jgi:HEAT repeat protein/beta-lactamase regulating signal transducer with metallopeptidase domain